jgi:hypothetical protein
MRSWVIMILRGVWSGVRESNPLLQLGRLG